MCLGFLHVYKKTNPLPDLFQHANAAAAAFFSYILTFDSVDAVESEHLLMFLGHEQNSPFSPLNVCLLCPNSQWKHPGLAKRQR